MLKLLDIIKTGKKDGKTEKETEGAAARKWKKKRRDFTEKCKKDGYSPPFGELANFIDCLTPDGYDKKGKKVSFVEKGRDVFGSDSSGISKPGPRVSEDRFPDGKAPW